jgi:hypothetical protein
MTKSNPMHVFLAVMFLVVCFLAAERMRTNGAGIRDAVTPVEVLANGSVPQELTAGQAFKNIQVLKTIPSSQLQGAMDFIAASLGVGCDHCHVGNEFEKDEKPTKQMARRMIQMMFDLNRGSFVGKGGVTCYTCHRGRPRPLTVPAMTRPDVAAAEGASPNAALPSVDQVLDDYVKALGGRAALERLTTRVIKGSRVNADNTVVPVEVYQKAPNKILTLTIYPSQTFYGAFDGAVGWSADNQGKGEINEAFLTLLKRDGEFFQGLTLKEHYANVKLAGKEKIGGRDSYVVEATAPDGSFEKFYFDSQTALLVQRYRESKTVLGALPNYVYFDQYREVDGVKLPFVVRWAMPSRAWSRMLGEVKHNVPIDDSRFAGPPAKRDGEQ